MSAYQICDIEDFDQNFYPKPREKSFDKLESENLILC